MAPRLLALLGKVLLLDGGGEESGNEDGASGRLLVLQSTLPPLRPEPPPLTIDPKSGTRVWGSRARAGIFAQYGLST
jgi:hypothetical protein